MLDEENADPALDEQPLLVWDEEDAEADRRDWVYRQADRLVQRIPPSTRSRDDRTEGQVFDQPTLMVLHKMLAHGVLKSVDFPISTGKEANVFRGSTPRGGRVAVKIYRVNTATFRDFLKYIDGDERFEGTKGDRRTMVGAWCQKEFRNLIRMREVGIDVPEPIKALQNVLVTEYLGTDAGPWPTLKELGRLEDPDPIAEKIVNDYVAIHNDAGLVHADCSEYNVLLVDADRMGTKGGKRPKPRVIDVGQAVLLSHPMAHEFLARDIKNMRAYFRRQGVEIDKASLEDRLRRPSS